MASFNEDQGFIKKAYAQKKIVRGQDGRPVVIYVDARTGKQLDSIKGYTVLDSGNVVDETRRRSEDERSETTQVTKGQNVNLDQVRAEDGTTAEEIIKAQHDSVEATPAPERTGYGYTNKPTGMGFLGFLPGIAGTLGTAANLGINASNTAAVNEQRRSLGMSDRGFMSNAWSTLTDQQGYIGDVQYTDPDTGKTSVTPVGFEAEDPVGRTTYTPQEARMRMAAQPTAYDEASVAARDNARKQFATENPGWASSFTKAISNVFNKAQVAEAATMEGKPGTGEGNPDSFPDAPDAPDNTDAGLTGDQMTDYDTSSFGPGLY